jgi:competence protein ComEC
LFHTSLSQPESSLLLGIVFGISESMPKEFQTLLSSAGVLHVIAASGMNVTMIGGFLTAIFGKVLRRQYALLASIVAIIFYAALAGFTASIVRASIMGILVFSAQIIGRQTLALYGLLLAGFLMLFFQPFLLFDTGFQLSFMATWGLIVFSPLVQSVLPKHGKIAELLAESDFSTTFIAQVVTLPILLGTFGSYSPVSILANFLVLWTIPILMIVGAAGTLVGLVMPFFGRWLLYLSLPLLIYFETVVRFLGGLPVGFKIEKVAWEVSLGYYLLLLALLVWLRRRKADA